MRAVGLGGKEGGADKHSLIYIERASTRSTINYGCFVYGAAAQTN